MNYTVTLKPSNWRTFLSTSPHKLGFRDRMGSVLKKVKVGDRIVVYVAEEVAWGGVFKVTRDAYLAEQSAYGEHSPYKLTLETEEIVCTRSKQMLSIKTEPLFSRIERFRYANHQASGWIYGTGLVGTLVSINDRDTDLIIRAISEFNANKLVSA